MNLGAWDTCSIVSIALVNKALEDHSEEVIKSFTYREDKMIVRGTFGAWSIVPGGSERLVNVAMPIKKGSLKYGQRPIKLDGVTIYAQMKLRLIPAPSGDDEELRFDTRPGANTAEAPIRVFDVDDPSEQLDKLDAADLMEVLSACLSANAEQVSFVFASVKARGTVSEAWLDCPHHDWAFVDAGADRQYLALVGGPNPRDPDKPFRLDHTLIATKADAYFAASNRLVCSRLLAPMLNKDFRPRTTFTASGEKVRLSKHVPLAGKWQGPIWVEPMLEGLTLTPIKNALNVVAVTRTPLPLDTSLDATVDIKMPFRRDPKTGGLSFTRDPKPKITKKLSKSGILGHTLGLIVELVVAILDKPINTMINTIAQSMQKINNPSQTPIKWRGIRDFQTDTAQLDGCLWMADLRPATPLQSAATPAEAVS